MTIAEVAVCLDDNQSPFDKEQIEKLFSTPLAVQGACPVSLPKEHESLIIAAYRNVSLSTLWTLDRGITMTNVHSDMKEFFKRNPDACVYSHHPKNDACTLERRFQREEGWCKPTDDSFEVKYVKVWKNDIEPVVIHPGAYLMSALINNQVVDCQQLAIGLSVDIELLTGYLNGTQDKIGDIADKLDNLYYIDRDYWNNLVHNYQQSFKKEKV